MLTSSQQSDKYVREQYTHSKTTHIRRTVWEQCVNYFTAIKTGARIYTEWNFLAKSAKHFYVSLALNADYLALKVI